MELAVHTFFVKNSWYKNLWLTNIYSRLLNYRPIGNSFVSGYQDNIQIMTEINCAKCKNRHSNIWIYMWKDRPIQMLTRSTIFVIFYTTFTKYKNVNSNLCDYFFIVTRDPE